MSATRKRLVKEADRVFSLYIRNRGERYGYNHCFTCGVYLPVEALQCGHFRPRRYLSTRWHPFNCWPSCNRCNVELNGNLEVYEQKLRNSYGDDAVDAIFELSHSKDHVSDDEIKEIIKVYKHKLK